jgi:biotin carboxyl carrier protein
MTDSGRATTSRYQVTVGGRSLTVELIEDEDGLAVRVADQAPRRVLASRPADDGLRAFVVDGRTLVALVDGREGAYTVVIDGEPIELDLQDERAARLASATAAGRHGVSETSVKAPMPGLVVAINVEPGQAVTKGTSLVVLQAMKMENELSAREDATIKEVLVAPGQTVDQGQTLVTLE